MADVGEPSQNVEEKALEGGCNCGALRVRLQAPPLFTHCCHCTWCQRESGAAFAVNALIELASIRALTPAAAAPEVTRTPSASGAGQAVARCPRCRTAVWSVYGGADEEEGLACVKVGALDAPGRCPPDIHIYTSTRLPWVVLGGTAEDGRAMPIMREYYDWREQWPAESQRRLNILKGRAA